MMPQTSIKINQFSYMRIIACFAIILLHSLFASTVYYGDTMTSFDVMFERIFEHLLMWAVPLFLMISGALLLEPTKEVTLKKLYMKYVKRLFVALIVFTLLFQILDYVIEGADNILEGWLKDLLLGQSWAHMWYLYMMIGLYIMLPLYRMISANEKFVSYAIIVLLIFTSVVPMIESLNFIVAFGIPTTTVYPLYLFLGYYFHDHKPSMFVSSLLLIIGTGVIIFTSCLGTDEWLLAFSKYNSLFVIIQTVGIFGLMEQINFKNNGFVESLNQCAFGIYLIHMIGIRAVMKWLAVNPYAYGPLFFILLAIVLFFISYGVAFLIRKIPKINIL